jgi:hypothetical protein
MVEDLTQDTQARMSQFLTIEHFTLQGARNGAIAEANGRLGHYLAAVGSTVVALAFVADVSHMGAVFLAFSAVLLPVLIFLGFMTSVRTLQIGVNDALLAQAINRIRHYYIEMAPQAEPYFSFPHHDDQDALQKAMRPFDSPLQGFASTPGPVTLINSVLSGVLASIFVAGITSLALFPVMVIGLSISVLTLWLHSIYGLRIWRRGTRSQIEVRFPTPER